jgi:hypothetical protein
MITLFLVKEMKDWVTVLDYDKIPPELLLSNIFRRFGAGKINKILCRDTLLRPYQESIEDVLYDKKEQINNYDDFLQFMNQLSLDKQENIIETLYHYYYKASDAELAPDEPPYPDLFTMVRTIPKFYSDILSNIEEFQSELVDLLKEEISSPEDRRKIDENIVIVLCGYFCRLISNPELHSKGLLSLSKDMIPTRVNDVIGNHLFRRQDISITQRPNDLEFILHIQSAIGLYIITPKIINTEAINSLLHEFKIWIIFQMPKYGYTPDSSSLDYLAKHFDLLSRKEQHYYYSVTLD